LAGIILTLQRTKPLENLANIATPLCGDDVISDIIKNAIYRQRRTFNKSFSKGKTWHGKSIAKKI